MRRVDAGQILLSLVSCVLSLLALTGCYKGGGTNRLFQGSVESALGELHRNANPLTWSQAPQAEITMAQKEARRRWSEFVAAFKNWTAEEEARTYGADKQPRQFVFEVKVPLGIMFATENVWLYVTELNDKNVVGQLDTEPKFLKFYRPGTSLTVPVEKIEDWVYGHDRAPVGGFTTLVLQKYKLQEMLGLETKNGTVSESSNAACNNELERLDKYWLSGKGKPSGTEEKSSKEMQDWQWWQGTSSILADMERSISATEKRPCTPEMLAQASGLPLKTIDLMKKMDEDYLQWLR